MHTIYMLTIFSKCNYINIWKYKLFNSDAHMFESLVENNFLKQKALGLYNI